mmetsp:Transcript_5205/g.12453  ORF Transcript_5205/g.12453 Transcript_5205/m.12453 type:complete len:307 (+) Transcript_5205:81-1001(+)
MHRIVQDSQKSLAALETSSTSHNCLSRGFGMTGSCEDKQKGEPSYESSTQNEIAGPDMVSSIISARPSKATDDGSNRCVQTVSSDEESESKSRKRRLSKQSDVIERPTQPSAPLPDVDENISPDEFLLKLVDAQLGYRLEPKKAMEVKEFFHKSTDGEVAAYTTEVVTAVRDEELDHLRKMQENGQELNCFNRFGESLLNLACRRGFESIVRYLMDQPSVTVKSSDDCGRTPLHDACWHPQPQLTICKWILEEEPALFFIMDRRGCTAFQYARPQHWPVWRKFLLENRQSLDGLKDPAIKSMLSKA